MDIRDNKQISLMTMTAEELARDLFQAFQKYQGHYYNMEACRDVAERVLPKLKEPVQDEVIEKGDTVKYKSDMHIDGWERVVTWSKPNCKEVAVSYKGDIPTRAKVSNLVLIHKGPKVERSINFKFTHSPGPDVYHFGNGFRLEPGYRPVEGQEIEIAIEREPDVS